MQVCCKHVVAYFTGLPGGGVVTAWHLTPASSEWTQLCEPIGLAGQAASLASVPAQLTLSSQIDPVP